MAKRRSRAPTDTTAPSKELHAVIAGLPVFLWACDLDGTVTLSEGGGLSALGVVPGQLVGASIWEIYKEHPYVAETARRAIAGESQSLRTVINGASVEGRLAPVLGDGGKVVGMVGFGIDVTERVQSEQALRGLSRRFLAVLEEERRRIARDIHDEAGQIMTALKLELDLARAESDDQKRSRRLDSASGLAARVIEELRRVTRDLRPGALEELGLGPSVEALVKRFRDSTGVEAGFQLASPLPALAGDAETTVFRFVQEALTNISRHARAKRADVVLERSGGSLKAMVSDDGIGFEPAAAIHGSTLGLVGMIERARIHDGRVVIDSARGRGTRLSLELPVVEKSIAS